MRIVLFKGQSRYGSLRLHADQLSAALNAAGHDAQTLDLVAPDADDQLNASIDPRPDCYFGFGGVGANIGRDGRSVYDLLGCVYASLYLDNPVHLIPRLSTVIDKHVVFVLDRSHKAFLEAWPGGSQLTKVVFMPPGANELPEPVDLSDEAFARRDIPLLFTGTYRGPPAAPWRDQPEGAVRSIMEEVARRMCADATLPILSALRATLKAVLKADLTPDLLGKFAPVLHQPQLYAEAYHRNALIEALGAAGVPITVYGVGWEPVAARHPSFTYGGEGSFEETLHLLRRARLVLNTNNGFVDGGHERVFTAMCGGAAVISDHTPYYAQAFKLGTELSTFKWARMNEAPAQIKALLADGTVLAAQARAGALKAKAEHTWGARAELIAQTIRDVR